MSRTRCSTTSRCRPTTTWGSSAAGSRRAGIAPTASPASASAYLIRERGEGSPVNQYAPFYLWHDVGGMSRFLVGGGGFQGVIDDFGRPPVRHWTGIAMERGPGEVPRSATRETTALPEDVDAAVEELHELARDERVHTAALAFDPTGWQLVRFVLSTDEAPGRYQVLHVSAPSLREIPQGRHW